jgi:transcription antitermination factor NusG
MLDKNSPKWFVIKTNPRAEKKVYERICSLGIETYLPLITTIRQWSDRKKKVEIPLLNSTLFVHCSESELVRIYNVQGFHSFLYYLKKPAIVRDYEINNLRILLKEQIEYQTTESDKIIKGDKVEVIRGPFQGLIATSIEIDRSHKLIVEIEGLEQKFIVHVPRSYVEKLRT